MKNYIENQQRFYINDSMNIPAIEIDGEFLFESVKQVAARIGSSSNRSIEFLNKSLDEIEGSLDRWTESYLTKIDAISNMSQYISESNLGFDSNGLFTLMNIDKNNTSGIIYSTSDNGYILSPSEEVAA